MEGKQAEKRKRIEKSFTLHVWISHRVMPVSHLGFLVLEAEWPFCGTMYLLCTINWKHPPEHRYSSCLKGLLLKCEWKNYLQLITFRNELYVIELINGEIMSEKQKSYWVTKFHIFHVTGISAKLQFLKAKSDSNFGLRLKAEIISMLQYLGKTSCLRKAELRVQGIPALVNKIFW